MCQTSSRLLTGEAGAPLSEAACAVRVRHNMAPVHCCSTAAGPDARAPLGGYASWLNSLPPHTHRRLRDKLSAIGLQVSTGVRPRPGSAWPGREHPAQSAASPPRSCPDPCASARLSRHP